MPLFREWTNDNESLAAIWLIEEPEEFFTSRTDITSDIKNEKRRLEHLAARFLLQHLEEEFPLLHIEKDEHNKPRIPDNRFYFSISHSWPYVAVTISTDEEVGIDIETWHPRIHDIQHKFLTAEEAQQTGEKRELITLAWSAKEAAFKWLGLSGVDFKKHLPIVFFSKKNDIYNISILSNLTKPNTMINLEGLIQPDFCCAYVISSQPWAIY